MSDGVKPCPFCGAKVRIRRNPVQGGCMYVCDNPECGADVMFYAGDRKGRRINDELWNRRENER